MGSVENQIQQTNQDEEDCLYAIQLVSGSVMPMVMQAAMDLELFHIIAKAGEGAKLSPSEIASQLTTKNPEAAVMVDRILRLLVSYSVITASSTTYGDGKVERLYGLAPVCKYLLPDEHGVSLSSCLSLSTYPTELKTMAGLKDTVLEGGDTFTRINGCNMFSYFGQDPVLAGLFNRVMFDHTSIVMKRILAEYNGFQGLNLVVDVAGGVGTMSSLITTKYPAINCINFDLPPVIEHAPPYPRVKHVGGDMFASVPKGDAIFLKWILHNWSDENCVRLLKKCYEAIPAQGKVIVVDATIPDVPESSTGAKGICQLDLLMMVNCPGGRERTQKELECLAKQAGFNRVELACFACKNGVLEFYK
uniref:Putative caffeic acid 3-O-methyltransferase n=1 Tax=Epimedium sagittatum TaxID=253616 RepID=A0A0A7DN03_9MAGN|nr:putative caffeic acid 3-O-methyltransferase [Epimedium sagittatum]